MKNLILIIFTFFAAGAACNSDKPPCIDKEKINPQAICTQQYEPVCGCNQMTYGNACEAENAGVTSWTEGECAENPESEA